MIRVWRGYELDSIANEFPAVSAKYGLRYPPQPTAGEFLDIALEISKISQAAYAALVVGTDAIPAMEVAAALSELFSVRAKNIAEHGRFVSLPGESKNELYPWVSASETINLSSVALRACLTTFRFLTVASRLQISRSNESYLVIAIGPRQGELAESSYRLMALIGTWSDVDLQLQQDKTLRLRARSRK